jgi:hypothetical protein
LVDHDLTQFLPNTKGIVAAHLAAFAEGDDAKAKSARFAEDCAKAKFPAGAGDLIYLTEAAAAAFGALPSMPALVLAIASGMPMALIAYATEAAIKTARISSTSVLRKV